MIELDDWPEELYHAYTSAITVLEDLLDMKDLDETTKLIIRRCLKRLLLSSEGICTDQTPETLRGLIRAYMEIYRLRGGAEIASEFEEAQFKVRFVSRLLRDAVVSSTIGLMETDDREEFLNLLWVCSNHQIGSPGADGENLKASLFKACHALFGHFPSSEPTKAHGKRVSRVEARRRRAMGRLRAYLAEQYKHMQQMRKMPHMHMQYCQLWYVSMYHAAAAAASGSSLETLHWPSMGTASACSSTNGSGRVLGAHWKRRPQQQQQQQCLSRAGMSGVSNNLGGAELQ